MKILFLMDSPEYLRFYDSAIQELAARGHEVAIAVNHQRDKKHSNHCEDRAENFPAVKLRPAERAKQTDNQQHDTNSKEQKIRPWKIARDWKLDEKSI